MGKSFAVPIVHAPESRGTEKVHHRKPEAEKGDAMQVLAVDSTPNSLIPLIEALDAGPPMLCEGGGLVALPCHLRFDLVLLDTISGPDHCARLCTTLRRRHSEAPIVALDPWGRAESRVRALLAGADDCMSRPIDPLEFAARVRAIVRRGCRAETRVVRHADLEFDRLTRMVRRGAIAAELTGIQSRILLVLMRATESVVTRSEIVDRVWGLACAPRSNVIDVHISALRRIIDAGVDTPLIHTVPGRGYRLGRPLPADPDQSSADRPSPG